MIQSKVREMMEEKGITVRKLMAQTGLADGTILRARDARIGRCTLDTLATIAGALGVKTKDLYEED